MGEDLAKTVDCNCVAQNADLLGMSQCTTLRMSSIDSDYIAVPKKPAKKGQDDIPAEGKTNSDKIDSLFEETSDKQVESPTVHKLKSQMSMIDPDKASILVNYDLDAFRNSIWENFLGS